MLAKLAVRALLAEIATDADVAFCILPDQNDAVSEFDAVNAVAA